MSKTKTVRAKIEDAFIIEQAARSLAAELQKEVKVSDIIQELVKGIEDAKKGIKNTTK